jgi:class 3 adenylate cyclase/tetratricopeptide (TPR) repeat protein
VASQPASDFPALLRRHRLLAGLSQEALADRAGLSVRGVSDLERGVRHAPHPATIARLADALDLDEPARQALLLSATSTQTVASVPVEASVAERARTDLPSKSSAAALVEERRWVSVVAVRIRGFGALAERLDPEDLHALADSYSTRITNEIRRLDGTVLRESDESILAVFGAPAAHEDDAERAVRAGLAITSSTGGPPGAEVQVRVGVDTGEVMAGLQGSGERKQYAVSGAPVSLALGLANASAPDMVVVGEQTYRSTQHHVRYRGLPPVREHDWSRPVPAWQAVDVAAAPQPRSLGASRFVGRDNELNILLGTLERVMGEERPHLVSLLGEAGIGKSRLIAEFEGRVVASTPRIKLLHGRCLPYGEVVGYRALAMALYEWAGITPTDAALRARTKLRDAVSSALGGPVAQPAVVEVQRHLALICGLDTEADRLGHRPDERGMYVSVRRVLEAVARSQPVCLIIEDLHWADQALLSLLEHVGEHAFAAPLFIVTQARPELLEKRPTWGGGIRAFTSLLLEPIGQPSRLALAEAICADRGVDLSRAEDISRLAGGNPLFAEELCAALSEGRETDGVPTALRALISGRLDALPADEKRALQCAAVLGKHVWQAGLAALDVGGDLLEHVEALERRDLLRSQAVSRFAGQREYSFKHDLIQEMAYGLLPRSERRRLHARAVGWLEDIAGERVDEILDLLAHHAVSAELHDRALDYLARGAERSRRAAAHREEATLLQQAIVLAERSGRSELIPELRARRGRALTRHGLWADARRELEAALAGLPAEKRERRAEVLVDLALATNWSLDTPALRQRASEALEAATSVGRVDLAMDARFWLAWATGSEGDVRSSIDQYEVTVKQSNQLGIAVAPSVLPLYSTALCWAGRFWVAIDRGREAVRIAREAGDTDSTILALQVLGLALSGTGAYDEASQVFHEAVRFGRDYGIGPFLARATAMSAGFHLDVFDYAGHAAIAEEACELARGFNFPPSLISASLDLLFNMARQGEVARADKIVTDVTDVVARAAGWHGWLWNLRFTQGRAELALARGDGEDAVTFSTWALEQARRGRPKYEILALMTRAAARSRMGRTTAAIADLRRAVRESRSLADPALFVRAATELLAMDGDDVLAAEARRSAAAIVSRLPTREMRKRFQAAEAVRRLGLLT